MLFCDSIRASTTALRALALLKEDLVVLFEPVRVEVARQRLLRVMENNGWRSS